MEAYRHPWTCQDCDQMPRDPEPRTFELALMLLDAESGEQVNP